LASWSPVVFWWVLVASCLWWVLIASSLWWASVASCLWWVMLPFVQYLNHMTKEHDILLHFILWVEAVILFEALLPNIIGGHDLWTLLNHWKNRSIQSILFYPIMVEPVYISVFDRFSGPIVFLKSYGKYNNQILLPEWNLKLINSVMKVPEFVEWKDTGGLFTVSNAMSLKVFWKKLSKKRGQEIICSVKHSYHTYIPQAVSQKVDCYHCPSQNSPSHLHVITMIGHALDNNDALFCCCV